jgi:CelD/BcsL family acetyltransferase involved in cellulose biosynthesis
METTWLASLDGLRPEWDRLAKQSPTSHPQYLYDWVEPWWRHVGSLLHEVRVMRVEEDGRTIAIAPFMLVRRPIRNLVTLRELRWLASGPSDQSDVLAGDARSAGRAVGFRLVDDRALWDELHLDAVRAGSPAMEAMLDTLRASMRCSVSVRSAPCYSVDTSTGDWEGYFATRGKRSVRRNLPQDRRRLEELGHVDIRQEHDLPIADLIATFAKLHEARQAELGRQSALTEETNAAFFADAFERFRNQGLLQVWTLHVGDDVGALVVGFKKDGVFYWWNITHNPIYGSGSPGTVLMARVIQACFEDKDIREFDMMRGDTPYKLKWANKSRDLLDIRVRNHATIRSAILNGLRKRTQ